MHYYEGSSWTAEAMQDYLWLVEPDGTAEPTHAKLLSSAIEYTFGCQVLETGQFTTQVSNGIMGFADTSTTLVPELVRQGKLRHRCFALCFNRLWPRSKRGVAGAMILGGTDERLHEGPIHWTQRTTHARMKKHKGIFMLDIVDLRVRSSNKSAVAVSKSILRSINRPKLPAFVDSGTQDTYLPSYMKHDFLKLFKSIAHQDYGHMQLSPENLAQLPVFEFEFSDQTGGKFVVEMHPWDYMVRTNVL